MTKVLVLGAGGQIARWAVPMLAGQDVDLTLLLRDAGQLAGPPRDARVVEGDVLDRGQLDPAVRGQDVVYANLTGAGQLLDRSRALRQSGQVWERGYDHVDLTAGLALHCP
jgi:uncharacterized protein YbjT (DUF2867 family)